MLADGLIEPQVRHLHGQGQGSTGFGFVDPLVTTTLYRCRNYDVVTGANRFDASEVPAGLAKYAQESTRASAWWNVGATTSGDPEVRRRVLAGEFPGLSEYERSMSSALNADYARMDAEVHDGDEIAFLPPVSGG